MADLNKNQVASFLNKKPAEFTRADIVRYITENNIEMVNFMYPATDGHLKTLNFVINDLEYLETILTLGERVDGSSLFPFIKADSSDLYVVPRYRTAFVDPFAEIPTLCMLCSFYDKDGQELASSPQHILDKACDEFTKVTGMVFHAMGELEFYVIAPDTGMYPAVDQKGYHESAPFAKFNDFRTQCMLMIARTGGRVKYGHCEVGNFTLDGKVFEQNEIEFLPVDAREAADQLMLAKWVIRNEAARQGLEVTFAPKITAGKAGSGLHIHIRLMNADGSSATVNADGSLSAQARRGIAGLMRCARAITAFGNTNPTSYFRLVPHQEAPTTVCWGDRNRSVLVRVPLGWNMSTDMCSITNGAQERLAAVNPAIKQTFEIRSADGSADIYLLIASIAVALRQGLEMEESEALALAGRTYVDTDIHRNAEHAAGLDSLPASCRQSADALEKDAGLFTARGVFAPSLIAGTLASLRAYDDAEADAARNDTERMLELVKRHFHCG